MYDNERYSGINWKNIISKIIFLALFVVLLMWLFPKVPNMEPFYSNVFRENISYMQNAAKSHFTNERLPKNTGDTIKLTLQDMISQKLIIPFIDENGKSCNTYESYVSVTKNETDYTLKVNLVCEGIEDYILETLGCYDKCEEPCDMLEYQFKKKVSKDITSCKELKDKISATAVYEENSYQIYDPIKIEGGSTTIYADYIVTTGETTYSCPTDWNLNSSNKCVKDAKYREPRPNYNKPYSCPDTVPATPKTSCSTVKTTGSKSNCTLIGGGFEADSCGTGCTKSVWYNYYKCCTTSYTCSQGTLSGSSCIINKTCYEITDGFWYCQEGEKDNKKCYKPATPKTETTYTCPSGYDKSGERTNTVCSKVITGEDGYVCNGNDQLINGKCYKLIQGKFKYYTCPNSNYKLEGSYCYLNKNKECKTSKKITYEYKWSTEKSLEGWIPTGETRKVPKK